MKYIGVFQGFAAGVCSTAVVANLLAQNYVMAVIMVVLMVLNLVMAVSKV